MQTELEKLVSLYRELGIDRQIDYDKFYLYSLITHSTAIEGSTITELENQIMFDQGVSLKGKSILEQNMNLDLKNAYEYAIRLARAHAAGEDKHAFIGVGKVFRKALHGGIGVFQVDVARKSCRSVIGKGEGGKTPQCNAAVQQFTI